MLNIVIPMAGLGSRFSSAGFTDPKPLISVHGKPMIQVVVENLTPACSHRFIFVCQKKHIRDYDLDSKLCSFAKNVEILGIDYVTDGQLSSVLLAKDYINNDDPVMTANSDQYIDFNINKYLHYMGDQQLDGLIMTMKANDPKWSYARTDANGYVLETAEKRVISDNATVGIFNFCKGSDLVWAAEKMIADNVRVNGEFYICPCYNYLLAQGRKVSIYSIGSEGEGMYGLGIPQDLSFFLAHPVSAKVRS